jgi:hypothetical protein
MIISLFIIFWKTQCLALLLPPNMFEKLQCGTAMKPIFFSTTASPWLADKWHWREPRSIVKAAVTFVPGTAEWRCLPCTETQPASIPSLVSMSQPFPLHILFHVDSGAGQSMCSCPDAFLSLRSCAIEVIGLLIFDWDCHPCLSFGLQTTALSLVFSTTVFWFRGATSTSWVSRSSSLRP